MRTAGAGEWLKKDLLAAAERLGEFPHDRLNLPVKTVQKAGKRPGAKYIKCGYEACFLESTCFLVHLSALRLWREWGRMVHGFQKD